MYSNFKDKIYGGKLAEIGSLSSLKCGVWIYIVNDRWFHQRYVGWTFDK